MRFLHTSDWHLGRRLLSAELLGAQREFLHWLLDQAVGEHVAGILVSGDVYDRAQPSVECVDLLDEFLVGAAAAGVPVVMIPGNHDSAVRLRYGGRVFAHSGIHLIGDLASATTPVVLQEPAGPVGIYGIPYLHPDSVFEGLGVPRTHEGVLGAVCDGIRLDATARGLTRTVVLAHAFVTGAAVSDSERGVSVGGIGDAPACVFDGFSLVALGHLHGPQDVALSGSSTRLSYSGSPLAFSFSERDHVKSVSLVEIGESGAVQLTRIPTPVPRPLRQVTGTLAELLARARTDLAELSGAWVKVVLTDAGRPADPLASLRAVWPHTLVLEFAPQGNQLEQVVDLRPDRAGADPAQILGCFASYVCGGPPGAGMSQLIAEVVAASADRGEEALR